ncbi:MAG: hypothetical protein M3Q07_23535 [Pseudobdellovibrionaceae bacterium]|nr:hypothetical protein [Pseudobdellovibrionaceae bacterium]
MLARIPVLRLRLKFISRIPESPWHSIIRRGLTHLGQLTTILFLARLTMKKTVSFIMVLLLLFACSNEEKSEYELKQSVSIDMNTADSYFSQRDAGREESFRASQNLKALIDSHSSLNGTLDYLNLVEYYAKTVVYQAQVYIGTRQERKKAYLDLVSFLESTVSPSVLRFKYAGYYYFKSLSYIHLADEGTAIEQLQYLRSLNETLADIQSIPGGQAYEGGGLFRVKSRLKSALYYQGIPGGTYNPAEALRLIETAISQDGYPGQLDAKLFCENHLIKGDIERFLGKSVKRHSLLRAQVTSTFEVWLEDEIIPEYNRAEDLLCMKKMKAGILQDGYRIEPPLYKSQANHFFTYDASATFIPTDKQRSGTIRLEAYCPSSDFLSVPENVAKSKTYDYSPALAGIVGEIKLNLASDSIPCGDVFFVFDPGSISVIGQTLKASFKDYGETNESYVESTRKQLDEDYSIRLVNFSITMAQQLLAQPNMFCYIKDAKNVDSGFLRKVKATYFEVFGVTFDDPEHQFACPPDKTLVKEITECRKNPALSTPFCNSYRSYQEALDWVLRNLAESRERLARLNQTNQQLKNDMDSLIARLGEEVEGSKTVLGTNE